MPLLISNAFVAVEKRKKQLKEVFSIDDGQDETLLVEAKKMGFL